MDEGGAGMKVVVLGAGLMGAQIACEYALGGHEVTCVARRVEEARWRVRSGFALVGEHRLAEEHALGPAAGRVQITDRLAGAPADGDVVVESLPEQLDLKAELLREAAGRMPDAILASNTSAIPITTLGEAAGAPERTVGTHYWNPPLLMPLVEVIRGEGTSEATVDRVVAALRALGKRPIRVTRDVPGFVWNRLQLALLREAAWIVENGVTTPEAVDEIMRDGLARRWRLTGPFETVALGGPETFTRVAANLFPHLSNASELRDIGRWLGRTPEELAATRQRRDSGLVEELRADRARNRTGDVAS